MAPARRAAAALLVALLAGCVPGPQPGAGPFLPHAPEESRAGFRPEYLGVETRLLEGDLVEFIVRMRGARSAADVADYAKCAAAQYALIRGYGFARHLRTTVHNRDGIWRADAVYTVSAALPPGRLTLDAEVVVENCRDEGIPTV